MQARREAASAIARSLKKRRSHQEKVGSVGTGFISRVRDRPSGYRLLAVASRFHCGKQVLDLLDMTVRGILVHVLS